MVKVTQKTAVLIAFSLLCTLVVETSLPHRVRSTSRSGSGYIAIQDLSEGVAKLIFVLDEETGSPDFHERSTSWLVIEQFDVLGAIPIGCADPDWKLAGTNEITVWHWELEKTFFLQYHTNGNPSWKFPNEEFTVTFYIATNLSRRFRASIDIPNFSVITTQTEVDLNQFLSDVDWSFHAEGCPYFLKVVISVFHGLEYKMVITMLYLIVIIVIAVAGFLFWKRSDIKSSDFFRISSSLLIFAPVFFFTFRNSVAPSYLTTFDALCFIAAIKHGALLLSKIAKSEERVDSKNV